MGSDTPDEDDSTDWPCNHKVFCQPGEGGILHTIQTAGLFKDSKTFVDMPMKHSAATVLDNFSKLSDQKKETLLVFIKNNFDEEGSEIRSVDPVDWVEKPKFIDKIGDNKFKELALKMNQVWKHLTRKITKTSQEIEEKSSLIYLENPFVVPGGRFREVYYWDSYWTVKGLLLCEMTSTTKGMVDNFRDLIRRMGHIPNGNRVYYSRRSQPPMFAQIVQDYIDFTDDLTTRREFISEVVWQLEEEFNFWKQRMVNITTGDKTYQLARYRVEGDGPRPESYREDLELASKLPAAARKEWYMHMKSGAESGWDYSSRWFVDSSITGTDDLLRVKTGDIAPVDLNSFLCKNAYIISRLFQLVEREDKAKEFQLTGDQMKESIKNVLYDETEGMWFDYNVKKGTLNKDFYPSNLSPLYTKCFHKDLDMNRTVNILASKKEVFDQPGGIPSSTQESGQQWDFPNVWPPLVELTVTALENTETDLGRKLAEQVAHKFLNNVLNSYSASGNIYEKYNCSQTGKPGGGGEYDVQEGFGWTNGVSLYLLSKYPMSASSGPQIAVPSLSLLFSICLVISLI